MSLSAIHKRAAAMRPDLPIRDVLEYLMRHWNGPSTEYCAYGILTAIGQLGLSELQAALRLFTNESFQVLKHKWTLLSSTDRWYISDKDLQQVLLDNEYQHPITGEVVADARKKFGLVYEAGPELNAVMLLIRADDAASAA